MSTSNVSVLSYKRFKSAHGRLQSLAAGEGAEAGKKPRQVRSARETREAHESSTEVFPESEEAKRKDKSWGRTQYGDDYGPKSPVTPVPVRPVSPTRRNNPHPAQSFLVWKFPARIHGHNKVVQPSAKDWKYVTERFYDDYIDTQNTGDAKNEVPITNLAKIQFPGSKKNATASTPHLKNGVSGTKAHLHTWSNTHQTLVRSPLRPPSPKARVIQGTLKGNTVPIFKEWLKSASSKEKDLMLQMLGAAHNDSENIRIKKATEDVLQPDSVPRVQEWLQNASEPEKKMLLGVLESLAMVSGDSALYPQPEAQPENSWRLVPRNHYRSYSYPITLRPRRSSHHRHSHHTHTHHTPTHTHASHSHYSRHTNSHYPDQPHSLFQHHCATPSSSHGSRTVAAAATKSNDMELVGKKVGTNRLDKTPELWNHKVPVAEEIRVLHPGSVFHQPKKNRGRHFAIHPEWPIA